MMARCNLVVMGVFVALVVAGAFRTGLNSLPRVASGWSKILSMEGTMRSASFNRGWMSMMSDASTETPTVEAPTSSNGKKSVAVVNFSTYAVGQEYSGLLMGAKAFGVFVDIATGTNVLLPRSQMTKGNYEKLKRLADSKSQEKVSLEIISVSAENSTLSGKYLTGNYKNRPDISALKDTDFSGKFFNATVISSHDFGLFAELDDYGVEGLVPASKLPKEAASIQSSYP
jgi:predicted RNA-binding protein with RPS1 domain